MRLTANWFICVAAALSVSGAKAQPLASRVLVVYNTTSAASANVANHYIAQRGIPAANLCAITTTATEAILASDYTNVIKTPIRNCLNALGRQNILYIVFTYDTPFALDGYPIRYSVDQYVADIWDQYTTKQFDPQPTGTHGYYGDTQNMGNSYAPFLTLASYRSNAKAQLIYSVWRLDGSSEAIASALVDKAMQAEATGGPTGVACFDRRQGDINNIGDISYGDVEWGMHKAAEFSSRAGFSVIEDSNGEEIGTAPAPSSCGNTALYAGWYSYNTYNDVFTWVPGAIGFHVDSASALNPRAGTNWVANALNHGITVTSGSVTEPYEYGIVRAGGLYRNLLQGANVGDAFLRNTRWIKWVILNVGDPLYVPFANGRLPFNPPPAESSLAMSRIELVGGTNTSATITLAAPAPAEGTTFALTTPDPHVSVPGSVTVPAGSSKVTIPITTQSVTAGLISRIQASSGPVTLKNTIVLDPLLGGIGFSQSVVSAGITITGTVGLNDRAPVGGAVVALTSSDLSVATVPASVAVPAGLSSATFPIQTYATTVDKATTIKAKYAGAEVASDLTATRAISYGSFATQPARAGQPDLYEMFVSIPAPAGGAVVNVSVSDPAILTAPSSITIAEGSRYGNFSVFVSASAPSGSTAQLTVSYGGDSRVSTLTVQ